MLLQIHQRILKSAEMNRFENNILYTVPPFIFGLPKIDLQDCIVYLVHMLRQEGFSVRFTYPNFLFISWEHHLKEYLTTQNPIFQAMMPPEVKKEKRNDKKVSFSDSYASGGGGYGSYQQQTMPIRDASEYQPPNSYIQTVQRPQPQKNIQADLWSFT